MNKRLKAERKLLSPPGDDIKETLEYYKMSKGKFAAKMGKTICEISHIIKGKEPITVNTALQLERLLGMSAQYWLNRESNYREKLLRIEQEDF